MVIENRPDCFRADQKLKRIESVVQLSLGHWQTWDINHPSGKPVKGFDHALGKEMSPHVESEHLTPPPPYSQWGSQL